MAWREEDKLAPWAPSSSHASSLSCSPGACQQSVLEMVSLHLRVSELSSWLWGRLGLLWGVLFIQGVLHNCWVTLTEVVSG